MRELPAGTVTFLFTDVEGSTKLLHELGAERYAEALAEHRRVIREAFTRHGGFEVDTQGDAFFVAFPTAPGALAAASEALAGLSRGRTRVRMGIHTGTPFLAEEGYVGPDVNRAARIAACGHGGQVLVSASTASLVDAEGLRDLGEHRLKDLSAPERIFQLGDVEFPPLRSLHQTNLPVPATPFLGRETELGEIVALITRAETRLLTLTGPGGIGKTRLGLQAAAAAAELYPDGVWWVPLAPLRDSRLVLDSAAQVLGAKGDLAAHIGDKSLLLFLDNFEHVIDAAPDLSELLAACPNLHLLVTSRELLRLPGEQAYPVAPLDPDDSIELFVTRAREALPSFVSGHEVHELCRRLEHLPLALELAAARVRVLSTQQLLDRLARRLDVLKAGRGVDARQQTLRATIEWSHDLLEVHEQTLFARLAVFRGGCTLDAAEDTCDADLDLLQSLVDKSLVRVREGPRFWMLETVREFAAEQLEQSGEAGELRRRHANHFLALAEEAEPHIRGTPTETEWLDRLDPEHDNFRAALDWFDAAGETQLRLQLAGALWKFWNFRANRTEGSRRLEDALRADERPTAVRARALVGAAGFALATSPETARLRAEEALALYRTLGDRAGAAVAVLLLGWVCTTEKDFARALALFEESAAAFRDLGDDHYSFLASTSIASTCVELGDVQRARAIDEDGLLAARAAGNIRMEATFLERLADWAIEEGRGHPAARMVEEALRVHLAQRSPDAIAAAITRLAGALAAEGYFATAAQLVACSEALLEEIGGRTITLMPEWQRSLLPTIREELDEASFARAWEEGRKLGVEEAVTLARRTLDSRQGS